MKLIWVIARKELRTFFDSLVAYILLVAFLGFSGFFTWLYGSDVFFVKQASLQSFFGIAYWTLFFFIPALTMKMLAEENKSGTVELLLTKPITNWQVLWGKFLACFMLIFFALLCTLPYYITIVNLGKVDTGVVLCGYLGLLFMSAAYIGIGIFASSITNNQIVAFLVALFIGIFFQVLFGIFAPNLNGILGEVMNYLSLSSHYEAVSRGVVDTRDLVYFGSIIFLALMLAESSLSKRSRAE
ncbi:MAG TPA: ABC transporter permease [Bacteroidia bacterium]|jgi:ABC-2 type transport system permease protein|nr:ABC transporter permease [Bacteroidia bacterium]